MDDLSRDYVGEAEQASSSTLGADGKPVDDAVALNMFFTRFNKVCVGYPTDEPRQEFVAGTRGLCGASIERFVAGVRA